MGGDYTRWTFEPRKDYKSVFKQQGRVDLDADWNEFVEITDRRWRSESMDIAGQDFVSEITPDAFLITPVGSHDYTIGIGRLYVDGLVAECHGLPPTQFDPILGEMLRTNPVKYSNQPYLPSPLPLPIGAPNSTDLVYLDVWEREVTAIQDPHIREKALAGPDTCTRLQTVWQVKDLNVDRLYNCGDDIQSWDSLIAPSAGRLTTSTIPPNPSATPCILSQTGGYTGLENRLYRVEIHVAGTLDGAGGTTQAQFKWSRDNASVVAGVTAISASGGTNSLLNVTTLGRDSVLRFNVGDWVEVLDDYTEFQVIAGQFTKIISTDPAKLTITVNPPIPAALFNPGDSKRHTRVRRWDGRADLNSNVNPATGLIPVSAGPFAIEDGIQVSFSVTPAGGSFKVGDYWIFAARTFDASVEPLVNAPPRGILHHYCRLGFITWNANGAGTFSDCRPKHECECGGGCSVTVGDGVNSFGQFTDIQKAIDSLGPAGGVVCVGRGVYIVKKTILITDRNGPITLLGMGNATRVIYNPDGDAGVLLRIVETDHIRVQGFFMTTRAGIALIELTASSFCTIRDCTLVNLHLVPADSFGLSSAPVGKTSAYAVYMTGRCVKCDIRENAMLASKGILGINVQDLSIRDNDFLSYHGAVFLNTSNGLEIQFNLMRGISPSILKDLLGSIGGQLSANNITALQEAVTAAFVAPSGSQFMGTGVFLLSAFDVNISHNRIAAQSAIVGILLVEATIESNEILALVGILTLFVVVARVANNFIAGLFIGYMQMGIVIDLICEANFWLGYFGLLLLPFSTFLAVIAATLSTALSAANVAAQGASLIALAQQASDSSVGSLRSFGLALTVKIHRNDFFTFLFGVAKLDNFLSADISIVDNSFSLCNNTGIFLAAQLGDALGSSTLTTVLTRIFTFRHLVQSNSLAVTGKGIVSQCPLTQIRDNSITVPSVAVDLSASYCDVHNNFVHGDSSQNLPTTALIQLQIEARNIRITSNRINQGPGSGISLNSRSSFVYIEDNEIIEMAQNGITSLDEGGLLPNLSISRNTISNGAGGAAGGTFWHSGAIVLPQVQDLQVIGNTISNNQTPAAAIPASAIYCFSASGATISQNQILDNFTSAPAAGSSISGIVVQLSQAELLIQGNRVRGTGGPAIRILNSDSNGAVSVHHNHLDNTSVAAINITLFLVWIRIDGFLNLEDNMCFFTPPPNAASGVAIRTVAAYTNANGNTIRISPAKPPAFIALLADDLTAAAGTVMITSNTLLGNYRTNLPPASLHLIVANNFIS